MRFILIAIANIFFFQVSFSQNFASWNYQAECVDASINNVTKIKVTIFEKKSKVHIDLEKKMAIHAILIKGVVGGSNCTSQPPILHQKEIDSNKRYFLDFFGKKAFYNKYIVSVEVIDNKELIKNKIKQNNQHYAIVIVNKDLLRKDLTSDKIIKPITEGF